MSRLLSERQRNEKAGKALSARHDPPLCAVCEVHIDMKEGLVKNARETRAG